MTVKKGKLKSKKSTFSSRKWFNFLSFAQNTLSSTEIEVEDTPNWNISSSESCGNLMAINEAKKEPSLSQLLPIFAISSFCGPDLF